jgi:metallo-beta-lactamase family protein
MRSPNLTFLGAAGTVTGSRFLLELDRTRAFVDAGLYQGLKRLRLPWCWSESTQPPSWSAGARPCT